MKESIKKECEDLLKFYSESGENSVDVRFIFEIYSDNLNKLICNLAKYESKKLPKSLNIKDLDKSFLNKLLKTNFMNCCERLQNLCWKSSQSGNIENIFVGLNSFKKAGLRFNKKNKVICVGIISWITIIGGYACYKKSKNENLSDFDNVIKSSIDTVLEFIMNKDKKVDMRKKETIEKIAHYILEQREDIWIQKPDSLNLWKNEFKNRCKQKYNIRF